MKIEPRRFSGFAEAAKRDPQTLGRFIIGGLDRASQEVAREMRSAAPKAFSTLTNSIRVIREDRFVRRIAPGVNYARAVEEGTGPAAGRPATSRTRWH